MSALENGGILELQNGVAFPKWSSKEIGKIGDNPVVLRAIECIERHAAKVFYLMLIPDRNTRAEEFFRTFHQSQFPSVPRWDVSRYGYLTWAAVKRFCEGQGLTRTLDVFTYNEGQIFEE